MFCTRDFIEVSVEFMPLIPLVIWLLCSAEGTPEESRPIHEVRGRPHSSEWPVLAACSGPRRSGDPHCTYEWEGAIGVTIGF